MAFFNMNFTSEKINILFYVEPLIERDEPYFKIGWINIFCKNIINTLKNSEHSYDFLILTNEALAQKVNFYTNIIQITQKELLDPFNTSNYMDVISSWHCEKYTKKHLESYKKLILDKLNGFTPNIIITFSPVPFLKNIFLNTLILHHEYSIFSRTPYPQTFFLDPVGVHSNLFLNKFKNEIELIELTKKQRILLNNFKHLCIDTLTSKSPFKNILMEKREQFDYLVLLPLQFSKYYAFDDLVPFKSQYEYCVYILDKIPSNIGIIVNMHPEHTVISESAIEFLKGKYSNFIYEEEFHSIYASAQFIIPFVDAVITVSSSIGLQTLIFDKKLITLSNKTYSFVANSTNIDNIEKILKCKNSNNKDNFLYFILTKYAITECYINNSQWLSSFLINSLKKFIKHGISFSFYNYIDSEEKIFKLLSNILLKNKNIIPYYLNGFFIELLLNNNNFSKSISMKLKVNKDFNIQKFNFDFTKYKNIKNLKLNLLNSNCVAELKSIFLEKFDGAKINLIKYITSNEILHINNIYYFDTENPQIYFKDISQDDLKNSKNLIIEIRYLHFEKEALQMCIKKLNSDLQIKNLKRQANNKLVFFGASSALERKFDSLKKLDIKPDYICDNDKSKHGKYLRDYEIKSPDEVFEKNEDFFVLITSSYVNEIKIQLKQYKNISIIMDIAKITV
jgi:hypothetical protein